MPAAPLHAGAAAWVAVEPWRGLAALLCAARAADVGPRRPQPPCRVPPAPQVGSIFEYANKHAIFDVIEPDSPLYAPILGVFVFTGFPTAAFLFYKSIQVR